MYCPAGYTTLFELQQRFVSIEHRLARDAQKEISIYDLRHAKWLFLRFVRSQASQMYAVTDHGAPMKLAPDVLSLRPGMPSQFPSGDFEIRKLESFLSDPFYSLNSKSFAIDLDGFKKTDGIGSRTHVRFATSVLAKIEGAPVCWGWAINEITDERLYHLADVPFPSEPAPAAKWGRPRKQEDARAAYLLCFPKGHGSTTWKMILQTIQKQTELVVSVTTLKRALELDDDRQSTDK